MATDLKTVTASRAELEREIASRRLAEQAVREREQTFQTSSVPPPSASASNRTG